MTVYCERWPQTHEPSFISNLSFTWQSVCLSVWLLLLPLLVSDKNCMIFLSGSKERHHRKDLRTSAVRGCVNRNITGASEWCNRTWWDLPFFLSNPHSAGSACWYQSEWEITMRHCYSPGISAVMTLTLILHVYICNSGGRQIQDTFIWRSHCAV